MVKNPPTSAGDSGDMGSTPGSKRSSVGGKGNPLQYSCLENSTDRGTWWATDQEVAESDMTEHMRAHTHTHTHTHTEREFTASPQIHFRVKEACQGLVLLSKLDLA